MGAGSESKGSSQGAEIKKLSFVVGEALFEHFSGLGAVVKISGGLGNYFRNRVKAREVKFEQAISECPEKAQEVFKSERKSEPLLDVFVSVYRSCLADDEADKAPIYAALMAGFALKVDRMTANSIRLAMVKAISSL